MKKLVSVIFAALLLIGTIGCNADKSEASIAAKTQAEQLGALMLAKDYSKFIDATYPKVVEMIGGKEQMLAIMENGTKAMETKGEFFTKISFGEPSEIIKHENELQCIIPQILELKTPNGTEVINSSLIAISKDEGKNWYFLDVNGKEVEDLRTYLPNLSPSLNIPKSN